MTVGKDKAEEDPGEKPGGETEMSVDMYVEVLGVIEEMDKSIGYIVNFMKTVKLYQKKRRNCFGYGSPEHLV